MLTMLIWFIYRFGKGKKSSDDASKPESASKKSGADNSSKADQLEEERWESCRSD